MAFSPQFSVLVPVLLCLLVFSFSTTTSSSKVAVAAIPPEVNERTISNPSQVSLTVYYNSLSVRSADFIVSNLSKIFRIIDIVEVKLVPFGNSRILKNGTILCEHGSIECKLDRLQACAMDLLPGGFISYFYFISCTERLISVGKTTQDWFSCLDGDVLHHKYRESIYKCYTSGWGEKLQLHNGKVTASLDPHLQFVPWVTVNQIPILQVQDTRNFMRYVCRAYRGDLPPACRGKIS